MHIVCCVIKICVESIWMENTFNNITVNRTGTAVKTKFEHLLQFHVIKAVSRIKFSRTEEKHGGWVKWIQQVDFHFWGEYLGGEDIEKMRNHPF